MIEFNLFLIDHWYYSLPLFLFLVLWWRTESRRGGKRISTSELTTLVNKENAKILDVRPKDEFEKGTITNSINIPFQDIDCLLYTSPSPRDATLSRMPSSA